MCQQCGCSSNAIGGAPDNLTGKPQDPYGKYDGVGGRELSQGK
jgi:hypothetical protein